MFLSQIWLLDWLDGVPGPSPWNYCQVIEVSVYAHLFSSACPAWGDGAAARAGKPRLPSLQPLEKIWTIGAAEAVEAGPIWWPQYFYRWCVAIGFIKSPSSTLTDLIPRCLSLTLNMNSNRGFSDSIFTHTLPLPVPIPHVSGKYTLLWSLRQANHSAYVAGQIIHKIMPPFSVLHKPLKCMTAFFFPRIVNRWGASMVWIIWSRSVPQM